MILHEDAIITKEIEKQEKDTKVGLILLHEDTDVDIFHEVIATGTNVKNLLGKVIRPRLALGEDLEIDFKPFKYFTYAPTCYFYIVD